MELWWGTAWLSEAPRPLDPLWGIESEGYFYWNISSGDEGQFAKTEAIRELQQPSPSPWVFADDWAISNELLRLPFWSAAAVADDVLLIRSGVHLGMSYAEVSEIERFVVRWV